jgi:hypothetical protein
VAGLEQAAAVPPSRTQVVVEPASALKVIEAERLETVPDGAELIETVGAVPSTVQEADAEAVLPAPSLAVTVKLCVPSARPL